MSVGLSFMRTDASNGTRYADILRTTEERLLDSLPVRDFLLTPPVDNRSSESLLVSPSPHITSSMIIIIIVVVEAIVIISWLSSTSSSSSWSSSLVIIIRHHRRYHHRHHHHHHHHHHLHHHHRHHHHHHQHHNRRHRYYRHGYHEYYSHHLLDPLGRPDAAYSPARVREMSPGKTRSSVVTVSSFSLIC